MSRCLTLEDYLERFVDENTQASEEEVTILVTAQQAETLGFFLVKGLAGFIERARLERGMSPISAMADDEGELQGRLADEPGQDEFIN